MTRAHCREIAGVFLETGDLASQQFHGVPFSSEFLLRCSQRASGHLSLLKRSLLGAGRSSHVVVSTDVLSSHVLSTDVLRLSSDVLDKVDVHRYSSLPRCFGESQSFGFVLVYVKKAYLESEYFPSNYNRLIVGDSKL